MKIVGIPFVSTVLSLGLVAVSGFGVRVGLWTRSGSQSGIVVMRVFSLLV